MNKVGLEFGSGSQFSILDHGLRILIHIFMFGSGTLVMRHNDAREYFPSWIILKNKQMNLINKQDRNFLVLGFPIGSIDYSNRTSRKNYCQALQPFFSGVEESLRAGLHHSCWYGRPLHHRKHATLFSRAYAFHAPPYQSA